MEWKRNSWKDKTQRHPWSQGSHLLGPKKKQTSCRHRRGNALIKAGAGSSSCQSGQPGFTCIPVKWSWLFLWTCDVWQRQPWKNEQPTGIALPTCTPTRQLLRSAHSCIRCYCTHLHIYDACPNWSVLANGPIWWIKSAFQAKCLLLFCHFIGKLLMLLS